MQIAGIDDVHEWCNSGSLNNARINKREERGVAIDFRTAFSALKVSHEPVIYKIFDQEVSTFFYESRMSNGIKCLGKIQGNEMYVWILFQELSNLVRFMSALVVDPGFVQSFGS